MLSVHICFSLAESFYVCESSDTDAVHRRPAEVSTESEKEEDGGKVGWFQSTEQLGSARLHVAEQGTSRSTNTQITCK